MSLTINQPSFTKATESKAEREGFEPSLPCGKHAFQACSIGHSDTSPKKAHKEMINLS
jgi:hypothetical protein